jgi:hypothetical protein
MRPIARRALAPKSSEDNALFQLPAYFTMASEDLHGIIKYEISRSACKATKLLGSRRVVGLSLQCSGIFVFGCLQKNRNSIIITHPTRG